MEIIQYLYEINVLNVSVKDKVYIDLCLVVVCVTYCLVICQCNCNAAHYAAEGGHVDVLMFLARAGFKDFDQQSKVCVV